MTSQDNLTHFAKELEALLIKYNVELYYEPACYQMIAITHDHFMSMPLCNGEILNEFTINY